EAVRRPDARAARRCRARRRLPRSASGHRPQGPEATARALRQRAFQRSAGRASPALHGHVAGGAGRAAAALAKFTADAATNRLPGDEAPLLRAVLLGAGDVRERGLPRAAVRSGQVGARGAPVIRTGSDRDLVLKPDVCVIGSGPGGAIVASRLSRAGAKVVVLEEGGYYTKADFDMQEATAYPRLYQDRGNRATADLAIQVLQGRAVGGGTVVNWTTSYRTPDRVLEHWRRTEGLALTSQ